MNALSPRLLPGRLPGTLPWMMAATAFLTVLALGAAIGLSHAGATLAAAGLDRATFYIVDADPVRRERRAARAAATIATLPEVAETRRVPEGELTALLEPSFGTAGLADLPLPALIEVRLHSGASAAALDDAAARLGIELEHGQAGLAPVAALVALFGRLAGMIAVIAVAATALIASLAARAALEAHGTTLAILHALGANDRTIATLVQRRTARDALIGAAMGLGAGLFAIWAVADRIAALVPGSGATLGGLGWAALLLAPLALAALATLAARMAILQRLAGIGR